MPCRRALLQSLRRAHPIEDKTHARNAKAGAVQDQIANIVVRQSFDRAANIRSVSTQAFAHWAEVTGVAMAARPLTKPSGAFFVRSITAS